MKSKKDCEPCSDCSQTKAVVNLSSSNHPDYCSFYYEMPPRCQRQVKELFRLRKDPCTGKIIFTQTCEPPCVDPPKEKCKNCDGYGKL